MARNIIVSTGFELGSYLLKKIKQHSVIITYFKTVILAPSYEM